MNFLLHRAFAIRDAVALGEDDAGIVGVGAMLPDLWKMADRRARIRAEATGLPEGRVPRLLASGVAHHRAADDWFHRTTAFVAGERRLRTRFYQTGITKLLLFAHAAWEMCLDGELLRREGDGLRTPLGRSLRAALPHVGSVSLACATGGDLGPPFASRVERIASAGLDGSLFDDYLSAEGIAFRLARMRAAFGLGPTSADDERRIADALRVSETEAGPALNELWSASLPDGPVA